MDRLGVPEQDLVLIEAYSRLGNGETELLELSRVRVDARMHRCFQHTQERVDAKIIRRDGYRFDQIPGALGSLQRDRQR